MTVVGLAFLLGLIVGGGVVVQAVRSGNANWVWRGHPPARPAAVGYGTTLDRRLHLNLSPAARDSITALSCRGTAAIDSLLAPLRPRRDSLLKLIRPALDSLFQTIRPAVELRRGQTRTAIRALLSLPQQQRYDSLNRAEDDQRQKIRDQGTLSPSGGGGGQGPCPGGSGGQGPRGGFDRGSR